MIPSSTSGQPVIPPPQLQLRRVLTLWDLVFYGIVLIQPIAAVPRPYFLVAYPQVGDGLGWPSVDSRSSVLGAQNRRHGKGPGENVASVRSVERA